MKRLFLTWFSVLLLFSGIVVSANAVVIDFTGGTAYLSGGGTATPNNLGLWTDTVDYYVQGGMKFDFIGGSGTIGDYYSIGAGGFVGNDVIHAHWFLVSSMVITKVDDSVFDINYVDVTSNTMLRQIQ